MDVIVGAIVLSPGESVKIVVVAVGSKPGDVLGYFTLPLFAGI